MSQESNPLLHSLKNSKILLIEPDFALAGKIQHELVSRDATVIHCLTGKEGLRKYHSMKPQVILCETSLPDQDGIEVLKFIHKMDHKIPVIITATQSNIDSTISALRLGAFDFIKKPYDIGHIISAIKRAAETAQLRSKVNQIELSPKKRDPYLIIGSSSTIEHHKSILEKIAKKKTDTTLIFGESGTGKELSAHALHNWSHRKDEPYVEINCASIPETLLESELFGHEKGAFTDARTKKTGMFELAGKGTLFLDEIGELPLNLQAKLLRVLETKRFRRLGGTQEIEVLAHITAATNKNLRLEVAKGLFRADLYYRLNALPVYLPPLRDRVTDIPELATYFVKILSSSLQIPRAEISKAALEKLMSYDWPGNIRELKNIIQRTLVFHEPDLIESHHIEFDELIQDPQTKISTHDIELISQKNSASSHIFNLPASGINLEQLEKELLIQALERARFNQTKAAKLLFISRHTLRYRLEKHNLLGNLPNE